MSETIIVAALTAGSALIGGLIGTIGTCFTAHAERKKEQQKLIFNARLEAYHTFSAAYTNYIKAPGSESAYTELLTVIKNVRMVSTPKTSAAFEDFAKLLQHVSHSKPISPEFRATQGDLFGLMYDDLSSFFTKNGKKKLMKEAKARDKS